MFTCFGKLYLSDSKLSNKMYSFIKYPFCATLPPVTLDGVDIAQAQIPPAGPTYNNMQNYSCQGGIYFWWRGSSIQFWTFWYIWYWELMLCFPRYRKHSFKKKGPMTADNVKIVLCVMKTKSVGPSDPPICKRKSNHVWTNFVCFWTETLRVMETLLLAWHNKTGQTYLGKIFTFCSLYPYFDWGRTLREGKGSYTICTLYFKSMFSIFLSQHINHYGRFSCDGPALSLNQKCFHNVSSQGRYSPCDAPQCVSPCLSLHLPLHTLCKNRPASCFTFYPWCGIVDLFFFSLWGWSPSSSSSSLQWADRM